MRVAWKVRKMGHDIDEGWQLSELPTKKAVPQRRSAKGDAADALLSRFVESKHACWRRDYDIGKRLDADSVMLARHAEGLPVAVRRRGMSLYLVRTWG